ncbi:MAG: PEGA domain-containing protein [Deltaproteobacteria bacterium]|nr:PEGA domain-containing protein [Deltaproteobacteria bacterium]
MRSTSSARKFLAVLLCGILSLEWTYAAALSIAEPIPEPIREPCILLKFSSPAVSESMARESLEPMPGLLQKELRVRWVAPQPAAGETAGLAGRYPEADDASLERISGKIAEALRRMDRMETREASALLSEAETEARKFRAGKTVLPYLAEIFLRRGLLSLWEGDRSGAEEMFARSRVLRPDFSPDPGLFSPTFRESWDRSGERGAPEAEILVQYLPPGSTVRLDGEPVGTTPGRFKVRSRDPVRVRVSFPGYQDMEMTGQWLPGDSEAIEGGLVRDRVATLGELLASSPEGKGCGVLLADLAEAAGASRVAILVLEQRNGTTFMKVLSFAGGDPSPALLGEVELSREEGAAVETASRAAGLLAGAGWPEANTDRQEIGSPWYHKKWFLFMVGAIAIGAAAAVGGGGGGGGSTSSTGTIGVTF